MHAQYSTSICIEAQYIASSKKERLHSKNTVWIKKSSHLQDTKNIFIFLRMNRFPWRFLKFGIFDNTMKQNFNARYSTITLCVHDFVSRAALFCNSWSRCKISFTYFTRRCKESRMTVATVHLHRHKCTGGLPAFLTDTVCIRAHNASPVCRH